MLAVVSLAQAPTSLDESRGGARSMVELAPTAIRAHTGGKTVHRFGSSYVCQCVTKCIMSAGSGGLYKSPEPCYKGVFFYRLFILPHIFSLLEALL